MRRPARSAAPKCCDAFERRYRYPFTNCTHCGPRLSIIEAIPYDRQSTTMRRFTYARPAQPNMTRRTTAASTRSRSPVMPAGRAPGWSAATARPIALDAITTLDDVDAAAALLMRGEIVAIKGLGGFQLACDATNAEAVARLRQRKRRAAQATRADGARYRCRAFLVRHRRAAEEHPCSSAAPIVIVEPRAAAGASRGHRARRRHARLSCCRTRRCTI